MKKRLTVSLLITCMVAMLAACGGGSGSEGSGSGSSNKLVVYTPNSEDMINALVPVFEKETGISVELVSAGSGELIKRLQSETNNPYGDVMFGGAYALYMANAELFEEYVSPNDQYLLEGHRNTTGIMTSYVSDGSVLLVNTNLAGDIPIEGYADLLNPALKGKIATADPANSSSAFAQLTNMLQAMGGDYTSDAGWDYVGDLIENLDGKIASGSSAAHKSVADGEYVVALTYEDPAASYVSNGAPVRVVYPKEGAVFLDAVAGIVKGAKNLDNAKLFIDFIISKEAQDALGTQTTNRPLRMDAQLADFMTPISDIHVIEEDDEYVRDHKAEIVERYTDLFTSRS
ncbi:ABC transporter substrate-binding protein [Paenibacillus daejeonensis]|uniref:ABC transporter substrate-binding protein n=1 Tax=Paenibacillus daejeonensis TaxID=135193 RepID=UPI000365DECC|nr:ABC transporter substrate-binding protein [Paenibacillus daejeonensis]